MFPCADSQHIAQTSSPRCLRPPDSRGEFQYGDPMDPRRALRAAADCMQQCANRLSCLPSRAGPCCTNERRRRCLHREGWPTAPGRPHADSALHRAVCRCRQDLHRQPRLQRRLPGHQHRADRCGGHRDLSARQRSFRLPPRRLSAARARRRCASIDGLEDSQARAWAGQPIGPCASPQTTASSVSQRHRSLHAGRLCSGLSLSRTHR